MNFSMLSYLAAAYAATKEYFRLLRGVPAGPEGPAGPAASTSDSGLGFRFRANLVDKSFTRGGSSGIVHKYGPDSVVKIRDRTNICKEIFDPVQIRESVANEVAFCRRLGGTGIVPEFRGFDFDDDNYYLVSEKFDDDITTLLWTSASPGDFKFMAQVVSLVKSAVYNHGVFCYDIKPTNIVYRRRGLSYEFRLIDLESCSDESKLTSVAEEHSVGTRDLQFLLNMVLLFSLVCVRHQELLDHVIDSYFTRDSAIGLFAGRNDISEIFEKIRECDYLFKGYSATFKTQINGLIRILSDPGRSRSPGPELDVVSAT